MTNGNYSTENDYTQIKLIYTGRSEEEVRALGEGYSMIDMIPPSRLNSKHTETFRKAIDAVERQGLIEGSSPEYASGDVYARTRDRQALKEFVEDTELNVGKPIDDSDLEPGKFLENPSWGRGSVPQTGEKRNDPFSPDGF